FDSVPPQVWDVIGDADINPPNSLCIGTTGWVVVRTVQFNDGPTRVESAEINVTDCDLPLRKESTAAHEVGHLLAYYWTFEPQTAAAQQQRETRIAALSPGGHECIAEAIGVELFALKGIGPYEFG